MRLTNLAAGIFTLALAGYVGVTTEAPAKGAAQPIPHAQANRPSGQPAGQPSSQQNAPQDQGQGPLRVQTNVVNVFATVRNKQHGIVNDLNKEDFKITEDGVEQKVEFFQKEVNMPITLGMLIDTSASMDRMIDAEHDAASRFLREVMRPKDEAMVITFDFDVDLVADFTQDTSVLASAIRSTRVNSVGGGGVVTPGTFPGGTNAGGTASGPPQSTAAGSGAAAENTAPAAGTVVARSGNIAIATTSVPGVLLANNAPGQQDPRMAQASSILLGAKQDIELDGGTKMVVGVAAGGGGGTQ